MKRELAMDWGIMTEIVPSSCRAKFFKKRYMGVCRQWSKATTEMMRQFPVTAAKYNTKNA